MATANMSESSAPFVSDIPLSLLVPGILASLYLIKKITSPAPNVRAFSYAVFMLSAHGWNGLVIPHPRRWIDQLNRFSH